MYEKDIAFTLEETRYNVIHLCSEEMYQVHCPWASWTQQQHDFVVGKIETTGGKFQSKKFPERKKLEIFGRCFWQWNARSA
jgi:hypothetical protein